MQLSVIILNYNVRYFLELCVLSVQKAVEGIDAEIIVVDNDSGDDSCEMIRERFPEVILIENPENAGFPKGNNIGVAKAKGDYVCILNPDTAVAEDTFTKMLAFAEKQPDFGIAGCKLIDGTGNFLPESKRGIPTPWVAFTKIFSLYKWFPKSNLFGRYYAGYLSENETGKVEILVGAFMLMKRELYLEVGGFDENCFMYSDDIDLSYRVLKLGKSNYYFHETTVIHYKGESTVRDGTYMKRFREAMEFFYKKHFNSSFFFSFFMQIGTVLFSFLKMLQGRPGQNAKPEAYILISEELHLKEQLETLLKKEIFMGSFENPVAIFSEAFSKTHPKELLLDSNQLGFKESIAIMERLKNKGFTFKILCQSRIFETGFLIGSNSSSSRGEVIVVHLQQ